jgi:hypothetical protein
MSVGESEQLLDLIYEAAAIPDMWPAARTTGHLTLRASASARISRNSNASRLTRSLGANLRSNSVSACRARRRSTVNARKDPLRAPRNCGDEARSAFDPCRANFISGNAERDKDLSGFPGRRFLPRDRKQLIVRRMRSFLSPR